MPIDLLALVAALLYFAATGLQLLHILQQRQQIDRLVFGLGLVALLFHAILAWNSMVLEEGLDLGFYKISSLIFLVTFALANTIFRRIP